MWRLVFVLGLVGIICFGTQAPAANAQTPPSTPPAFGPPPPPAPPVSAPPLQTGDVVWAFAQEPPFNDARVVAALGLMLEGRLSESAATTGRGPFRIFPADEQARQISAQRPVQLEMARQLFAAAGFASATLTQAGECRYWAAPQSGGGAPGGMPPAEAAQLLVPALRQSLAALGTQLGPCAPTPSPAVAHLLVWSVGGPPPPIPTRRTPTLLTTPQLSGAFARPQSIPPVLPRVGTSGLPVNGVTPYPLSATVLVVSVVLTTVWVSGQAARPRRFG